VVHGIKTPAEEENREEPERGADEEPDSAREKPEEESDPSRERPQPRAPVFLRIASLYAAEPPFGIERVRQRAPAQCFAT
jgi:hypothetical protein